MSNIKVFCNYCLSLIFVLIALLATPITVAAKNKTINSLPTPTPAEITPTPQSLPVQRIEQEDKLVVPIDKADKVWKFLTEQYIVDTDNLKKLDEKITASSSEENFFDVYFDTPNLQLLDQKNSVRHRKRENLTNPADIKNNRELLQIKVSNIDNNPLNRGEDKFDVNPPNNKKTAEDYHPVLGLLSSKDRPNFLQTVQKMGIDVQKLRPILTLPDYRRRIYLNYDGQPYLSISLDNSSFKFLWAKVRFIEIENEINEVTYTAADPETRQHMESINHQIISEIKNKYSFIYSDPTPKYNKAFGQLSSQIPFLRWLIKLGISPVGR